jgi:hypothetical protein
MLAPGQRTVAPASSRANDGDVKEMDVDWLGDATFRPEVRFVGNSLKDAEQCLACRSAGLKMDVGGHESICWFRCVRKLQDVSVHLVNDRCYVAC